MITELYAGIVGINYTGGAILERDVLRKTADSTISVSERNDLYNVARGLEQASKFNPVLLISDAVKNAQKTLWGRANL